MELFHLPFKGSLFSLIQIAIADMIPQGCSDRQKGKSNNPDRSYPKAPICPKIKPSLV
jgi:hypothetical protein